VSWQLGGLLQWLGQLCAPFPVLSPISLDARPPPLLQDEGLRKLLRKAEGVEGLLSKHPLARSPTLAHRLDVLLQKQVRGMRGRWWLGGGGTPAL
jgi:hypothetical protein